MSDEVIDDGYVTTSISSHEEPQTNNETIDNEEPIVQEEHEEPTITKGAQKRIDELTRQKHDERRRADKLANELDDLRNKDSIPKDSPIQLGAPDPNAYPAGKYDPDYLMARQDYLIEQKLAEREAIKNRQAKYVAIANSEKESEKVHSDFKSVKVDFLDHALSGIPAFMEIVGDSDNPAELMYFLGKNPKELDKISEMTPAAANRYIGRLEARINETPTQETAKVTSAPKPITPLGGAKSTVSEKKEEDMSMEEYAAWYKNRKK